MNTNSKNSGQEWLSLPSGITSTSHYSFTNDLLKQFDRKKHQILYDEDADKVNWKAKT